MTDNCIFCQIISRKTDANLLYQDDLVTAFPDRQPHTPVHLLVVPNRHYASLNEMGADQEALLGRMVTTAQKLAAGQGIHQQGFRLVINTGPDAGQSVFHVHLHVLGGRKMPFRFE